MYLLSEIVPWLLLACAAVLFRAVEPAWMQDMWNFGMEPFRRRGETPHPG